MNKFVLKLTTAVSTAALLTGSVASVAFGTTTVTVTGNGADSNNTANVDVSNSTTVTQSNNADIQNNVSISTNSGNNTASKNTGGDTSITTGDANVSSSVSNSANSNVAAVGCGTCAGNTDVKIAGNGADSRNDVDLGLSNTTVVTQVNTADVTNKVNIDAKTGKNTAKDNTGGDVSITTGDANVTAGVTTDVNQNAAQIGGGNGGGSLSAEISGNGADSHNYLDLGVDNTVVATQSNDANIKNNVEVDANSGYNTAKDNTGGDTSISTGDANVTVGVNNHANSNALDLSSCDCAFDGSVKIAGNGADSRNDADVTFGSVSVATQVNDYNADSECAGVDVQSSTGGNVADSNTVHGADPMISTGDAGANVTVGTSANSNVLGNVGDLTLPGFPSVHDFNGLLVLLMGMFSSH